MISREGWKSNAEALHGFLPRTKKIGFVEQELWTNYMIHYKTTDDSYKFAIPPK